MENNRDFRSPRLSDFSLVYNKNKYRVKSEDNSASWGKGVRFLLYSLEENHVGSITYSCHPEFASYELYQNKTISELTSIAKKYLIRDPGADDFNEVFENGIDLLKCINEE